MGGGKINKNPLFRVYGPKGKTESRGLNQGAYLQALGTFCAKGSPLRKVGSRQLVYFRKTSREKKSTPFVPLALGKAAS